MKPWSFQNRAVRLAETALRTKRAVLVVSPGASGKTVMIGVLARRWLRRGRRVLIVMHRRELVHQTRAHLSRLGVRERDVGVVLAGAEHLRNRAARCQIASIQTLRRRRERPPADLVIVDEAHHAMAESYLWLRKRYRAARHAGFTATPFRMDGKGLADVYDEMVTATKPSALLREGRIAEPIIYATPERFLPNVDSIRIVRGDYAVSELSRRVRKLEVVGNILTNWFKHARGKRTLVFTVTIAHSRDVVGRFRRRGVAAEHIDGTMSVPERERILNRFRAGHTTVLCNCMVLSEGFDIPACQAVVLARPSRSASLYLQQANRGLRYYRGRRPIILDHGRFLQAFGMPEADRHFSLSDSKADRACRAAQVRICPKCSRVCAHACRRCPECGHKFPEITALLPKEAMALLERYSRRQRSRFADRLRAFAKKHELPRRWVAAALRVWSCQ